MYIPVPPTSIGTFPRARISPIAPLRLQGVPPRVVRLVGIRHVDQVMGDLAPLRHGGLRGADVEVPIHLEGIGR